MNTLRTIQLLSRCYISRHSNKLRKSILTVTRNEAKKQCFARSRDLLTHPPQRLYSTEFNRHFVKMKRMKEEGYVPSDDEKQFEALSNLARQSHSPAELIKNEPMFLPTLLRLFESEKTMVRNSSIKLFASMPDVPEWLNFLETDASIQKHLPAILANFYSFATHPERPYGRQKAISLHERCLPLIRSHFGKTHPLTISVLYRLGILYSMEENTTESIRNFREATDLIGEFVKASNDAYFDDIGLVMQHATIYYEYLEALKKRTDLNATNAHELVDAGKSAMDLCDKALEMVEKDENNTFGNNQKQKLKELALKMKQSFVAA